MTELQFFFVLDTD